MDEELYYEIRKRIVQKLFRKGCFGKGHILIIRLQKGFPKHFIPYSKKALKDLITSEIVFVKKTKHGLAASLNMQNLEAINNIVYEES